MHREMKHRPIGFRTRTRRMMRASALALAACLSACLSACGPKDRVAGGFDDVENPALQASLLDTLGHAYGAGEVRLYARYQNPAKDSVPLIEATVPAGTVGTFRDTAVAAAMGRAKLRGIAWPNADTVEFNLVAKADQGEAFLGDFLMVKGAGNAYRFLRRAGGTYAYANAQGVLETAPILARPVIGQKGTVGSRGLELKLQSVFIPGSPYWAKVEGDGSFTLARMARGRYEVKALSADAKVYSAQDSLDAGTGAEYRPADWSEADLIWIDGP